MKKRFAATWLFLGILGTALAQNTPSELMASWKTYQKDNYSLKYPGDWELNETGLMGTSFIFLSKQENESDLFRENINLLVQDLEGMNIQLDQFIEITEEQVNTLIEGGKLIESARVKEKNTEYQRMQYSGKQGPYNLMFFQYIWVIDTKAYILTFTSEQNSFEKYKNAATHLLNSFSFSKG